MQNFISLVARISLSLGALAALPLLILREEGISLLELLEDLRLVIC